MAATPFTSKATIINNTWLNDVNNLVWTVFGGAATVAAAKAALGVSAAVLPSLAQGDTLFASGVDTLSALAKNASATRYLSNTGASNNPAWAQVALATGVSGTLPIANGGTAGTTAAAARTALGSTTVGDALYITASAATARATLGSTTVGDAVFIAANAAAARTATGSVIGTDVLAFSATAANTATVQTWTAAQRGGVTALTSSAASIAINLNTTNNFSHTLTENTTLAAPSNPTAGQSGVIVFTHHASAPKTLAYNAFWKFPAGTVPTLTATNSAVDTFTYYVESATRATCQLLGDVK